MKNTKSIKQLREVETHLRRKCKRYRKQLKGLKRALNWRNALISELLDRLDFEMNNIKLSESDFKKLTDNIGEVIV